jgi:hypothetical protein
LSPPDGFDAANSDVHNDLSTAIKSKYKYESKALRLQPSYLARVSML